MASSIHGKLPTEIGLMANLTILDLCKRFSVEYVESYLLRFSLTSFVITDQNRLTGEIPTELGQLRQLTYLDLSKSITFTTILLLQNMV